eukprot:869392-Amphidinium_carterae.3
MCSDSSPNDSVVFLGDVSRVVRVHCPAHTLAYMSSCHLESSILPGQSGSYKKMWHCVGMPFVEKGFWGND